VVAPTLCSLLIYPDCEIGQLSDPVPKSGDNAFCRFAQERFKLGEYVKLQRLPGHQDADLQIGLFVRRRRTEDRGQGLGGDRYRNPGIQL